MPACGGIFIDRASWRNAQNRFLLLAIRSSKSYKSRLYSKSIGTAAAAIAGDNTVAIEPVIDRDTEGVPGSPDISATIFAKITAADVVVKIVKSTVQDRGSVYSVTSSLKF
jgi:hypothetical protein